MYTRILSIILITSVAGCNEESKTDLSVEETVAVQNTEEMKTNESNDELTAGQSTEELTAGEMSDDVMAGEMVDDIIAGEMIDEVTAGMAGDAEMNFNDGTRVYPGGMIDQVILSNAPIPCDQISAVAPYLPDEAGHHAGSILSPSSYPFTLRMIEYTLEEPPDIPSCNSELAHRVEISVLAAEQVLPTVPEELALQYISLNVPSAQMSSERRVILHNLETPLILNEGEKLLISVSLVADGQHHLCIAVCEDEPAYTGLELWSNSANIPYSWVGLDQFQLESELLIKAIGSISQP